MQTRLCATLSEYTSQAQHDNLRQLLETGFIDSGNRVWVKLRADSLAHIFKQAREAENAPITADKTETAAWLATYMSHGRTSPRSVSKPYTHNVLRGNVIVDKTNQKRLKP